jgi:hypothetical protein
MISMVCSDKLWAAEGHCDARAVGPSFGCSQAYICVHNAAHLALQNQLQNTSDCEIHAAAYEAASHVKGRAALVYERLAGRRCFQKKLPMVNSNTLVSS